jgi:hypothetical protein
MMASRRVQAVTHTTERANRTREVSTPYKYCLDLPTIRDYQNGGGLVTAADGCVFTDRDSERGGDAGGAVLGGATRGRQNRLSNHPTTIRHRKACSGALAAKVQSVGQKRVEWVVRSDQLLRAAFPNN